MEHSPQTKHKPYLDLCLTLQDAIQNHSSMLTDVPDCAKIDQKSNERQTKQKRPSRGRSTSRKKLSPPTTPITPPSPITDLSLIKASPNTLLTLVNTTIPTLSSTPMKTISTKRLDNINTNVLRDSMNAQNICGSFNSKNEGISKSYTRHFIGNNGDNDHIPDETQTLASPSSPRIKCYRRTFGKSKENKRPHSTGTTKHTYLLNYFDVCTSAYLPHDEQLQKTLLESTKTVIAVQSPNERKVPSPTTQEVSEMPIAVSLKSSQDATTSKKRKASSFKHFNNIIEEAVASTYSTTTTNPDKEQKRTRSTSHQQRKKAKL